MTAKSARIRWIGVSLCACACAAVLGALGVSTTESGFTGSIVNPGSYSSGTVLISDTVSGQSACASSGRTISTDSANCAGSPAPIGVLPGPLAQTTSLSSPGTNFTGAVVTATNCGVQMVRDASNHGVGLVHQTVTFGATGPLSGSGLSFTQSSSAYVSSVTAFNNPENISVIAWFEFPTNGSGVIASFNTNAYNTAGTLDRSIWVSSGSLYWAVGSGPSEQSTAVSANVWHHVVAEIGSSGQSLYLDGANLASAGSPTSAQNDTGYWNLGWGAGNSWANHPNNQYWPGTLADVAVIPSQLTAPQVSTLWGESSNTAEQTAISALSPSEFWPLDDASTSTYTGSIPGVSSTTPYPDVTRNADNGTGNGGLTIGSAGPLSGSSVTFNGTTGWIQTASSFSDQEPVTVAAWFKTTVAGPIIDYDNAHGNTGVTQADRHLWVDNAGHLVWGVNVTSRTQLASPGTYLDGTWHFATASLGTAGTKLYVDGTIVATSAVTTAVAFTGWWHLGWASSTSWPDAPSSSYWGGGLAQVTVLPSQLSDAQVATLHMLSTPTAYRSAVIGFGATAFWPLSAPVSSPVCALVYATAQTLTGSTATCVLPVATGTCSAPSSSSTLATLMSGVTPTGLAAGVSQTLTIEVGRASVSSVLSGLHVLGSLTLSAVDGTFTASLTHALGPLTM